MMKKIIYTALALSCSLAVCSCTNDKYANTSNFHDYTQNIGSLHGYPVVRDWSVEEPVVAPPPVAPAVVAHAAETAPVDLPPPAPTPPVKKKHKHKKPDVREAS